MLGLYNEKDVDVVCIGGSSTFVYWEPFLAWGEYGITSYDFANNSFRPPLMKGCVEEAVKVQNPDLVVLDMRTYTGDVESVGTINESEDGIRNITDTLPLSTNRFEMVRNALEYYDANSDSSVDTWSYYFDIAKYHSLYQSLGAEESWKKMSNYGTSDYQGFEFFQAHAIVPKPEDYRTDKRKELNPKVEDDLVELLEYLQDNKINALFVAGPLGVDEDTQMQYNTIGDIVESYNYKFLNTNNYYEEMGIDFDTDFYNWAHTNVLSDSTLWEV